MTIPWYICTSDATRHIVDAQKHLFKKYLPEIKPIYLDLGCEEVALWCSNILRRLPDDDYCVFGLDDYLPVGPIDMDKFRRAFEILYTDKLDRFELGFSASRKKPLEDCGEYLKTTQTTSYSVSCQFAIWNMKAFKKILSQHGSPWNFEVKGECVCGCFRKPVFRWLESSALSQKRWPDQTNLIGLKQEDIDELIELKLVRPPFKVA